MIFIKYMTLVGISMLTGIIAAETYGTTKKDFIVALLLLFFFGFFNWGLFWFTVKAIPLVFLTVWLILILAAATGLFVSVLKDE